MKKQIVHVIITLLMITSLKGQIKIGDNPQTLDPSSVLELESSSRVLVITRVSNAQMNTITPLRGALVYNTDEACIHYYNGTAWVNICEALDNSFTVSTNAVFNQFSRDSTVVVTQTDNNYNFEVNLITGDNIVDTSINGAVDIQQGSITGLLLQDATITYDKLADGENTGEVLQWNGNEWILVDETGLVVTEVDGEIGNEVLDATIGGSLVRSGTGTDVDPFTLDVSDGGIGNLELSNDAITTDKIQDGQVTTDDIANLNVTTVKLAVDAVTGDKIQDGEVNTLDLADNAVNTDKIGTAGAAEANRILGTDNAGNPQWQNASDLSASLGENVTSTDGSITGVQNSAALVAMDLEVNVDGTTIEVDPTNGIQIVDNGVTTAKILDANVTLAKIADGTVDDNIIQWNAAASQWEETAPAAEVDGIVGNEVTDATAGGSLVRSGAGTGPGDPYTLDVANGGIGADELATDAVTNIKIANDAVDTDEIVNNAVTTAKILDANVTLAKIADGTVDDNIIQWNAAASQWEETAPAAEVDGIVGNEVTDATAGGSLVRSGAGTGPGDPYTLDVANGGIGADELATDAVTNIKIANDAVDTDEIVNNAVTTAKILDANVTLAKIADGTVDDNIIQWNAAASQWEETAPAAEVDGIVGNEVTDATAGGSLVRSGAGTGPGDPYTLDVANGGIGADELATDAVTNIKIANDAVDTDEIVNNAVTTAKILDANVTLAKIADGTVDDNIIQWNAAASQWEETAPAAEVDGIVGNEVTDATAGGSLVRSGAGTGPGDPYTLDVANGGIGADELATDAVTNIKIANDAVDTDEIVNNAVTTAKILDANVTPAKIEPSVTNGQILTTIGGNTAWQNPAVVAMGKVDATATTVNANGATVGQNSTGNYTVTFGTAMPDADYIIQLTLNNAGATASIEVTNQTTNDFTVQISDGAGTALDASWYFTVTDF